MTRRAKIVCTLGPASSSPERVSKLACRHTDDMVRQVETALLDIGSPPGTPGRTNALRVHRIGEAIGSDGPLTAA